MPNHKLFNVNIEKYQEKKQYIYRIQSMLLKLSKQANDLRSINLLDRSLGLINPRNFDSSLLLSSQHHPIHRTRCSIASKTACLSNLIHYFFIEWWGYLQDKDYRFLDHYLNYLEQVAKKRLNNCGILGDIAKGYRLKVRK